MTVRLVDEYRDAIVRGSDEPGRVVGCIPPTHRPRRPPHELRLGGRV